MQNNEEDLDFLERATKAKGHVQKYCIVYNFMWSDL